MRDVRSAWLRLPVHFIGYGTPGLVLARVGFHWLPALVILFAGFVLIMYAEYRQAREGKQTEGKRDLDIYIKTSGLAAGVLGSWMWSIS